MNRYSSFFNRSTQPSKPVKLALHCSVRPSNKSTQVTKCIEPFKGLAEAPSAARLAGERVRYPLSGHRYPAYPRMSSSVTRLPLPPAQLETVQVVSTSWISNAANVWRTNGVALIESKKLPRILASCSAMAT